MTLTARTRIFLAALVAMWLASIAHEPGGLRAFAENIATVEEQLASDASAVERSVDAEVNAHPDLYLGILCGTPAADGKPGDCEVLPTEQY
ncbi:MAG: hypothetical protein U0360_09680 [Dehalococcoidia bacterium]